MIRPVHQVHDGKGLRYHRRHIRQSLLAGTLASGTLADTLLFYLGSPVSRPQKFEDTSTPSRQRSKPIAIEMPLRNVPSAYTPLTGRGDHRKYVPTQQGYRLNNTLHGRKKWRNRQASFGASIPPLFSSVESNSPRL